MYEIELKARVDDRESVIAALNDFAAFCGTVEKHDTYYALRRGEATVTARIRTESSADGKRILLTYKRKERRTGADGTATEVNDEQECTISAREAVESLLADSGFSVALTKTKRAMQWRHDGALFELCAVPPLGDFLEIEMLSQTDDAETVGRIQERLRTLLARAGVPAENIESRYYRDLLREAAGGNHV
ncbi:MAG: class IV adenylate cyclase [Treponemataceae bacterium]|nr:class IV adenylate cyclase [Treponemataceae bacterium]MDE7391389.1 class IV adenylate cyclase [Treponemataceae bacterium]